MGRCQYTRWFRNTWQLAFGVLSLNLLGGCVNEGPPKPKPETTRPIFVIVNEKWKSTLDNDIPSNAYQVPNGQVLVIGYDKSRFRIAFAGTMPVLTNADVGTGAMNEAVDPVADALGISATDDLRSELAILLGKPRFTGRYAQVRNGDSPVLTITGLVLMQRFDDSLIRPFVILKASFDGPRQSDTRWSGSYVASLGVAKPLAGEGSWTSDGGAPLKDVVSHLVERSLAFVLADVSDPFPRNDDHRVVVSGFYPWIGRRTQIRGRQLAENDDWIALTADLPETSRLDGVHIMDKSVSTSRAATKSDRRIQ